MRLAVNPTRMELLRLKKRLVIARRGHKLLKDKQEELMNRILALIYKIRELRIEVERELSNVLRRFQYARALMVPRDLSLAFILPGIQLTLESEERRVMNVKIPHLIQKLEGKARCYGFLSTSGELDIALKYLRELTSKLLELAEKEKALELLADEIEKTRRRVNALEFVLIPNIEETVKFITLKLSENERADLTRLMRVKELVYK